MIKLILFYVEFDNGDSNCYQGVRAPTLDEARVFCKRHIDSNPEWEDVAYVGEISRAQAEGLWDLSCFKEADWPAFYPEDYVKHNMADRPFAYVCSPLRGDIEVNMERAREYSRQVFEAGYCPITPHIYFPQFLNDDIAAERESGMKMGEALLPICRALVICGDTISEGMRQEVLRAKELGIEVCALENIPPIPTLENYRNDLTGLENMEIAVSLIEGMTDCRFKAWTGGIFIYPDDNAYITVNMKKNWDFHTELCHVTFDANLRTLGQPMDTDGVLKLQQEIGRTHALLTLLESREFILSRPEMEEFYNSMRAREAEVVIATPEKESDKPSVIKQIADARNSKQPAAKRSNHNKIQGEER